MIEDVSGLGASARHRRRRRPGVAEPQRRTIPFDYAFRFALTGEPEAVQSAKVEVSVEAVFTAVSIGYGVVPEVSPVRFGLAPRDLIDTVTPGDDRVAMVAGVRAPRVGFDLMVAALAEALGEDVRINGQPVIGPATAQALKNGFKLNPVVADAMLAGATRAPDRQMLTEMFQVVAPPPELVQFKYALFDDATGREFQSEPILNLAGLGAPDGGRPFRYFARPIEFPPRSVIRMQITPLTEFRGELHVSLQGFKVLGGAGTPTGRLG